MKVKVMQTENPDVVELEVRTNDILAITARIFEQFFHYYARFKR